MIKSNAQHVAYIHGGYLRKMIKCHEYGITAYGSQSADIMFIGMAPARDEIANKKPFAGPSGKLLDSLLESRYISREDVYTTNLICWRTIDGKRNRDPYPSEIAACRPRLEQEIQEVKPKLIVGLGDLVAQQFIQKRAYSRGALTKITVGSHSCWFMHTYHPAAALREGEELKDKYLIIDALCADFARLPNAAFREEFPIPNYKIADWDLAAEVLQHLHNGSELAALDVETGQIDKEVGDTFARILCMGISCKHYTIVIPEDIIKDLVWYEDIKWLTHFGIYDKQVMATYGINITIHEDTGLLDYNTNENKLHKLKPLSHEELGTPFYEDLVKGYKNFADVPKPKLYLYNAYDTTATRDLLPVLIKRQVEEGTRGVYEKILIPASNTFADIQRRGIRVSKDNIKRLLIQWHTELKAINQELDEMTGGINLASHKQLSEYVYRTLRMPGGPSVDKTELRRLAGRHPFFDKLPRQRKLTKMVNTYLIGIYDDIKEDDLLHPIILIHGAGTGRPSYKNPPAQTLPGPNSREGGEEFGDVRSIFIPWDDDHILCEADYQSGEYYTAAAHSEDDALLADLQTGISPHLMTAAVLFNKPIEAITGQERSTGKTWNFRMFYALDAFGAAQYFNVPLELAKEWFDNFYKNKYHKFASWRVGQKRMIQEEGFVTTFHGRKRHFPLIIGMKQLKRYWRMAINDPIQADCVDNTLLSAIELHPILAEFDSYILMEGHDALLFDLNKKYVHQTMPIIKEVMERSKHERMPRIPIDLKLGYNWTDMHPYELGVLNAV